MLNSITLNMEKSLIILESNCFVENNYYYNKLYYYENKEGK
jgi:hypothetical protein